MNTAYKKLIPSALVIVLCFGLIKAKEAKKQEETAKPAACQPGQPCEPEALSEVEEFVNRFDRMVSPWFGFPGAKMSIIQREPIYYDKHAVELPVVAFKTDKDGKGLVIEIKGITAKKEDIKGHVGEGGHYAVFKFPSGDSLVGIKIHKYIIDIFAQMDITQEKKNPKGQVLSTSTYTAYNSWSQSLPCRIDPSRLIAEYADGTLRIKAESCEAKNIVVK